MSKENLIVKIDKALKNEEDYTFIEILKESLTEDNLNIILPVAIKYRYEYLVLEEIKRRGLYTDTVIKTVCKLDFHIYLLGLASVKEKHTLLDLIRKYKTDYELKRFYLEDNIGLIPQYDGGVIGNIILRDRMFEIDNIAERGYFNIDEMVSPIIEMSETEEMVTLFKEYMDKYDPRHEEHFLKKDEGHALRNFFLMTIEEGKCIALDKLLSSVSKDTLYLTCITAPMGLREMAFKSLLCRSSVRNIIDTIDVGIESKVIDDFRNYLHELPIKENTSSKEIRFFFPNYDEVKGVCYTRKDKDKGYIDIKDENDKLKIAIIISKNLSTRWVNDYLIQATKPTNV